LWLNIVAALSHFQNRLSPPSTQISAVSTDGDTERSPSPRPVLCGCALPVPICAGQASECDRGITEILNGGWT
jgi:hypothetical protein